MTVSPESQFFLFSIVLLWTKLKSRALFGAVKEQYLSSQVRDAAAQKAGVLSRGLTASRSAVWQPTRSACRLALDSFFAPLMASQ